MARRRIRDRDGNGIPDQGPSPFSPPTNDSKLRKYRGREQWRKRQERRKNNKQGGPDNDRERVRERNPGTNVPESPGERRRRGRTGRGPGSQAPPRRTAGPVGGAVAAAPRGRSAGSATPSPSTSPSARAAAGAPRATTVQTRVGGSTITTRVPTGGGGSVTGGSAAGSSGSVNTPGSSPTTPQYKPFDVAAYYAPAIDQIAKMRAASDATRQNQLDNLGKINEWYMKAQGSGQDRIQQALAASQAQASTAQQEATQRTSDYLQKAMQGVGGNADLMRSSGISAAITANQENENIAAQDQAFNARQGQALQQRQDDERAIWAARMANLQQTVNSNHLQRAMGLDQQETGLRNEMGKTDLAERQRVQGLNESAKQAAAQQAIDQSMANFTMGIKSGELGVKQFEAETARLTAQNRAKLDAATLDIKSKNLSLQQQKLQLQRWVAKQRVSDKEKDRLLKVGLAKLGGGTSGGRAPDATSYMNQVEANFGKPLNQLNRHDYGQVAHGLLNWLSGKYPNMTRVQAARMLRSYFDQSVTTDPRIKNALRTLFGG